VLRNTDGGSIMNPGRAEAGETCMKGLFCELTRDLRMIEYIRAWESRMEPPFRTFFDTGTLPVPCLCCAAPDTDRVARFEAIGEKEATSPYQPISAPLAPLYSMAGCGSRIAVGGLSYSTLSAFTTATFSRSLAATGKVDFYDNPRITLSTSSPSSP